MDNCVMQDGKKIQEPIKECVNDILLPVKEKDEVRMNLCDIFAEMEDSRNSLDIIFAI